MHDEPQPPPNAMERVLYQILSTKRAKRAGNNRIVYDWIGSDADDIALLCNRINTTAMKTRLLKQIRKGHVPSYYGKFSVNRPYSIRIAHEAMRKTFMYRFAKYVRGVKDQIILDTSDCDGMCNRCPIQLKRVCKRNKN